MDSGGDTRSTLLRRAGVAGGALVGGGAILGALAPSALAFSTGDRPPAKFGKGDIGVLNYALTLEYLEAAFYNGATANQRKNAFIPESQPLAVTVLRTVTVDENKHVALLKKALGKTAIAKPKFDFHGDNNRFNIKTPAYVAVAISILTIEARHAATVGLLRNRSEYGITPNGAFAKSRRLEGPQGRHQPQLHPGLHDASQLRGSGPANAIHGLADTAANNYSSPTKAASMNSWVPHARLLAPLSTLLFVAKAATTFSRPDGAQSSYARQASVRRSSAPTPASNRQHSREPFPRGLRRLLPAGCT